MRLAVLACCAAVLMASTASASANLDRARQNYLALINGTRQLAELTPLEIEELQELDRQIRAEQADKRTPRQKCIDEELEHLGQEPSRLALRTIDLKCSQR
jgi:hypothetical protein